MRLGHWHRATVTWHSAAESQGQRGGKGRHIKGKGSRKKESMVEQDGGKQRGNATG